MSEMPHRLPARRARIAERGDDAIGKLLGEAIARRRLVAPRVGGEVARRHSPGPRPAAAGKVRHEQKLRAFLEQAARESRTPCQPVDTADEQADWDLQDP